MGAANPNWKGGFKKDGGYRHVLLGHQLEVGDDHHELAPMINSNGYIAEHRMIMAKHLGRPLKPDEIVHHINGDKTDNRLENLELMSRAEHAKHHYPGEVHPNSLKALAEAVEAKKRKPVECDHCGQEFIPKKTKRYDHQFCSHTCARRHRYNRN